MEETKGASRVTSVEAGMNAYYEEADFDKAYASFKKAMKTKAKDDPKVIILYAISRGYSDLSVTEFELARDFFDYLKKAISCGLLDLPEAEFKDLISDVIIYCSVTNNSLHEDCTDSLATHDKIFTNVRAIETLTHILEYVVELLEAHLPSSYKEFSFYLDALKEISLRLSIMFGRYRCSTCNDLCTKTNWSYCENLEEKFSSINEKILSIDSGYKVPKKWKIGGGFSRFLSKLFANKNKYCEKCGKKLSYAEIKGKSIANIDTTPSSVLASVIATYSCNDCNHGTAILLKNIVIKYVDSNGWVHDYTVDEGVKDFFD